MANYKKILFILSIFLISYSARSQTTDLARIEYLRIPFSNGAQSLNRFRALLQAPIPIKKDYLVFGFEYRYLDLDFEGELPFDPQRIGNTQRIEANVGYLRKIKGTTE